MSRSLPSLLIAIAVMAVLAACSGSQQDATPRPVAYPRLTTYDTVYTRVDSLPVSCFEVNASATLTGRKHGKDGSTWLNVVYPGYADNSVIYLTFSPVTDANRDATIANRTERMALNTGGNDSEIIRLTSDGGFDCSIVEALGPTVTPLQFIATRPDMVITGAYYIATPGDSVKPYIDAVRADILHTLKHLEQ